MQMHKEPEKNILLDQNKLISYIQPGLKYTIIYYAVVSICKIFSHQFYFCFPLLPGIGNESETKGKN